MFAASAFSAAQAAEIALACPATLSLEAAGVKGWMIHPQGKHAVARFDAIGLYDGHPSGIVQLKPDNGDEAKPGAVQIWTGLDPKSTFWVKCGYRIADDQRNMLSSPLSLVRKLPARLTQCKSVPATGRQGEGLSCTIL